MGMRVLFVTNYGAEHVGISSVVGNIAEALTDRGASVAIVHRAGHGRPWLPISFGDSVPLTALHNSTIHLAWLLRRHLRHNRYDWFISGDSVAAVALSLALWPDPQKHIHVSMELLCPKRVSQRVLRWTEKKVLSRISKVIIQDEVRARILAGQDEYPRERYFFVPASRPGCGTQVLACRFFHEKFGLDSDKKVLLLTGSLTPGLRVVEAVRAASLLPERYVLVLHGWFPDAAYRRDVMDWVQKRAGFVYYSDHIFEKRHLDRLFAASDIGLVTYAAVDENYKYIGAAAGKALDFMRWGIPMIVNRETNACELVVKNQCGVAIDSFDDLGKAVSAVESKYGELQANGRRRFPDYEFSARFKPVLEYVLGKESLASDYREKIS
jgi:glycosyltransferase involved in cell wall biosynthesis